MDYKEIDRLFYRDGYRIAHQYLEKEISPSTLSSGIEQLYQGVNDLLEAFLNRSAAEGKASECKKGCSWCCHQMVYAVTHEFLYISHFVQNNLSREKGQRILEKARDKVMQTMNKSMKEQALLKIPCPFLDLGKCSIYQVRPMACRIYLSSSVRACKREFDEPTNERVFSDLFEFPLRAGRMMNEGFVAYLKQHGIQSSELPMEQGYSSLITLGQTMEGWIEGR
ncbi:MAG: YkgJ family cysteine cluster protein [Bacteroidota bacterium]